jgi:UDP-N-acetylglucosamine pyrophosphorylase
MTSAPDYIGYNPSMPLSTQLQTLSTHVEDPSSDIKYLSHRVEIQNFKHLRIGSSIFTVSSMQERKVEECPGDIFFSLTQTYSVTNTTDGSTTLENIPAYEIDKVMLDLFKHAIAKV